MGAWYSSQSSESVFLIGKLYGKTPQEIKFFSLTDRYLDQPFLLEAETDTPIKRNEELGKGDNHEKFKKSTELFIPFPRRKKLFCLQTYVQWRSQLDFEFIKSFFVTPKRTIYLVKINTFPRFVNDFTININLKPHSLFELIQEFLKIYFMGMDVRWLEDVSLDQIGWNIRERCHIVSENVQYLVTDFFEPLQNLCPPDSYCIMGFSWTDLYPEEKYNFALGEASYKHRSGVFSFGRFPPSTYNPENPQDITEITTDVLWKLLKVCSHEIGHLFGLDHCEFFQCHMNESLSMAEAMKQPLFFCPVCLRKIHHICQFDIAERYEKFESLIQDVNEQFPSDKWLSCLKWLKTCTEFLVNV